MNLELIGLGISGYFISLLVVYILTRWRANKKITEFKSLKEALSELSSRKSIAENELSEVLKRSEDAKLDFNRIDEATQDLQKLRKNDEQLIQKYKQHELDLEKITTDIENHQKAVDERKRSLHSTEFSLHHTTTN